MKNILFILTAILFCTTFAKAQELNDIRRLNDYKYFIVPMQFKTADEPNEYLLSSLTKHLLEKEGFTVLVDTERFPDELAFNPCLALKIELQDEEAAIKFSREVYMKFTDCYNNVIYRTASGKSKKKMYKDSYQEALRESMRDLSGFTHTYVPIEENKTETQVSGIAATEKPLTFLDFKDVDLIADNDIYRLSKIDAGYLLVNKDSEKRIAFISENSSGNYLYNSEKINGSIKILDKKTLEVEYFDMEENAMKKITYTTKK
ncbi:hypothetical protein [Mesonia sp. K7]|uniref:hypothetical protein n=1 Tax=Mesonia sp. K7 TaxID=2218606 RepID=UPI000DA9D340|nr:hypothetical protein [Mesonia sp. K7]PZD76998.1 hypothetical protein DNG35_10160 [Mesonia sp. K7]